ncbi:MAG: acetyl-CoA carboxylase biotin carboxyl carrier protein [Thermoanaerobaculia bacterium]
MGLLNFKEILELIDRVSERGIATVEIESAGMKVRIDGKRPEPVATPVYVHDTSLAHTPHPGTLPPPTQVSAPAVTASEAEEESEQGLHIITSPIVGTFYRSPNPEADSFVGVGDRVSKGAVLCIIEAMKLMNEIESDVDGVIAKIYPQNGQPIEYGEKLFAVRAS